jgi:hypothetical protein
MPLSGRALNVTTEPTIASRISSRHTGDRPSAGPRPLKLIDGPSFASDEALKQRDEALSALPNAST